MLKITGMSWAQLRRVIVVVASGLAPGEVYGQAIGYARTANVAGTALDVANSFHPTGGTITPTRNGVGDYRIEFSGSFTGAVELVSAAGSSGAYCKIGVSGGSASLYSARILCFNAAGNATDTQYSFQLLRPNNPQRMAYSWVSGGNAQAGYSWNPDGAISATTVGVGVYQVDFAGIANSGDHVEVTAYGNNNTYCYALVWAPNLKVRVKCVAPNNTATNSDFNVTYVKGQGQPGLGFMTAYGNDPNDASYTAASIYAYNSGGGGAVTVTRPAVGRYAVRFPGINPWPAANRKGPSAQVIGYGADADPLRCSIETIQAEGADVVVTIQCFGTSGAAKNGLFNVLLLPPQQGRLFYLSGVLTDNSMLSGTMLIDTATGEALEANLVSTGASAFNFTKIYGQSPVLGGTAWQVAARNASNTMDLNVAAQAANLIGYGGGPVIGNLFNLVTSSPGPQIVNGRLSTAQCTYSVNPASYNVGAGGATNVGIGLNTQAGCAWNVTTTAGWVTILTATGVGANNARFDFAANATGAAREAVILIGGAPLTVSQAAPAGACTFTLSQTSVAVRASGGTSSITVNNMGGANCNWTVTNTASWIVVTAGAGGGTGTGTVGFNVLTNTGNLQRTATLTIAGINVTVTQSGGSGTVTSGMKFVPLTPCRLVDTRSAYAAPRTGAFGPPQLAAGSTRTIVIPASTTCTVPATAKAYVFNVTLDTIENGTGPVDFVTVYPTGDARPDYWTARTTTGGYIANAAIVKAGVNGAVDVYTSNQVNFILDINGYFTDDVDTVGLLYYPIQPCRAVDTRGPVYSSLPAPYGNSRLQAKETRTLRIPGSPNCQIPAAAAYSTQLTLAPGELTNGNPVAYLTAWPAGVAQPNISNMNAYFGYAVANSGIIPASSDGSINVFAFDATNLIIDVNGYFAADDGTGRGLYYFPATQCRVMNTQDLTLLFPFGGPPMTAAGDRTLPVPTGRCSGLPASAKAWAANATVVPGGNAVSYLSMWPSGTPWPNISQLNAFQGQTVSNFGIVPASATGAIDVRVAGTTHVAVEIAGYFGARTN